MAILDFFAKPGPTPEEYKNLPTLLDYAKRLVLGGKMKTRPSPTPTQPPQTETVVTPKTIEEWYARGYDKRFPEATKSLPTATPTPTLAPAQIPGFTRTKVRDDLATSIVSAAKKQNIDPALLAAILFQESGIDPKVTSNFSPGGEDVGLAQINLRSHPDVTREQALDPSFAINFAAQILAANQKAFGGDTSRAVAAYNVGRGGASIKGQNPYGGGPRGQEYLNRVSQNLDPELIRRLGLLVGKVVPAQ